MIKPKILILSTNLLFNIDRSPKGTEPFQLNTQVRLNDLSSLSCLEFSYPVFGFFLNYLNG